MLAAFAGSRARLRVARCEPRDHCPGRASGGATSPARRGRPGPAGPQAQRPNPLRGKRLSRSTGESSPAARRDVTTPLPPRPGRLRARLRARSSPRALRPRVLPAPWAAPRPRPPPPSPPPRREQVSWLVPPPVPLTARPAWPQRPRRDHLCCG